VQGRGSTQKGWSRRGQPTCRDGGGGVGVSAGSASWGAQVSA
jgi:hypothetical protein